MTALVMPCDLETWAFQIVRDAPIGEIEFSQELPRVGRLLRVYGQRALYELLINTTSAGLCFTEALALLERRTFHRLIP